MGIVTFPKLSFEYDDMSIGPVNAKPEGTINSIFETLSPRITLDANPETVQLAEMVGVRLFRILKV